MLFPSNYLLFSDNEDFIREDGQIDKYDKGFFALVYEVKDKG